MWTTAALTAPRLSPILDAVRGFPASLLGAGVSVAARQPAEAAADVSPVLETGDRVRQPDFSEVAAAFIGRHSRIAADALANADRRSRDDLVEFEMLLQFSIARGVRTHIVDLSILRHSFAINRTARLVTFKNALERLRGFGIRNGQPTCPVHYAGDREPVMRVVAYNPATDDGERESSSASPAPVAPPPVMARAG
ncbi:hypothetical protein [Prosthecodimorpha staleyi]|uniref:Uncharacterized protein n=1 Tax=Prosthecodimorpha staleyi TaxID=2840188 RepID=A0A947D719_9HYPH|nr:hypothetical protein [Prosthecodimorpha staleyi]MBT9290741.1 hypothetical protein [Prosthecodimorpha staleyi]